jgi:signal transduction histidine kinase
MTLRTRLLVTAFCVMTAVLALLTLTLAVDALARTRAEQLRQGELVAAWAQDWVNDHRETLAAAAGQGQWADLARRLGRSPLVADWAVAVKTPAGLEVAATRAPDTLQAREVWAACLEEAVRRQRTVIRGVWVGAPLLLPDGRVYGLALAVPAVGDTAPDIAGTFVRMAWVMALGTALLLLVMFVLLNRFVLRPLDALAAASARVARGDFSRPVPPPAFADEVTDLVRAFNFMMERLADQQRSLREDLTSAQGRVRDTERKLVAAERLSSTGTLAAGIAHEINNPLGGLLNAARALQARAGDDPRARQYTALILEGLSRIQDTVRRLLQFAPRAGATRPFALADAVESALALCEHRFRERGVRAENAVGRDLPLVHGDAGEIQQAVLNVLLNAADAVRPGEGRVSLAARATDGQVLLTITDNGAGMGPDTLRQAADPFFTTKAPGQGTGLGLAVVETILEHHGGTLGLASEPGRGTEVTLALPAPAGTKSPDAALLPV